MNPFSCLASSGLPAEQSPDVHVHDMDSRILVQQSQPPLLQSSLSPICTSQGRMILPSLASASRSVNSRQNSLDFETAVDHSSFLDGNAEHFVFRSRRIADCEYEPYKVLLLVASAPGYHHRDVIDPQLTKDGVSQCKAVSSALRKAKQSAPDIIFCSSMHRAIETLKLVCPDWYDAVSAIVALDELRPQIDTHTHSKRSERQQLQSEFKKVSFQHVKYNTDQVWNLNRNENSDAFQQRIYRFMHNFLLPRTELLQTQYGTLNSKEPRLENVGWNDRQHSPSSPAPSCNGNMTPEHTCNHCQVQIPRKRVVVVTHCDVLTQLMNEMIDDISMELCKQWQPCDVRKVFVYTKQQLGMANIPCYKMHNGQYYSPRYSASPPIPPRMSFESHHSNRTSRSRQNQLQANTGNTPRSKTPNKMPSSSASHKTTGSLSFYDYQNKSRASRTEIATTSRGDILMTNTNNAKLFAKHTFTLTTMSAQLCDMNHDENDEHIQHQTRLKREPQTNSSDDDDDEDDEEDEDDEIRVVEPGCFLHEETAEEHQKHASNINALHRPLLTDALYSNETDCTSPALSLQCACSNHTQKNEHNACHDAKQHFIVVSPPAETKPKTNRGD